ncbi:MAG: hypothetical protein GEV04_13450 [Actinophytocola sp.]|nr:hypothetical protein [Actinophytocola sp.]
MDSADDRCGLLVAAIVGYAHPAPTIGVATVNRNSDAKTVLAVAGVATTQPARQVAGVLLVG